MATVTGPGVGNSPSITTTTANYTTVGELLEYNAPDNRDELIKTYGDQGITGFLKLTNAVKKGGTADYVQYWEEKRRHQTVTAGANDNATGGTVNLTAVVPEIKAQDVVMNAASGEVFICTTDGDVFSRLDGSTSNVAWGATDELIILGNMYAQGTDQPSHFVETSPTLRKNSYMIVKDTFKVNGSQATNIGWVNVNGDYRWFVNGEQETRARFEDKREMMMLFAEQSGDGDTIASEPGGVAGSEGYFAAVEDRGIVVSGAAADPIDTIAEIDNLIIELDKQGAPAEYALYLQRAQDLKIDDMLATGLSSSLQSGLPGQFGAFNNGKDRAVALGFKSCTRGGYTFHKHSWKLLNDPTLLGASTKFIGAGVPMTTVVDPKTGERCPALEMNYKDAGGYSRELEHWITGGAMGITTNNIDEVQFNYRSEIALVTRAANQHFVLKG